jgi:hypothetical protein
MPETSNDLYPIKYKETDSSNIAYCSFDPMLNNITVYFRSGYKYDFFEVPEDLWRRLCTAPSPGRFFNNNIKGQYEYRKVGTWTESELDNVIFEDYKHAGDLL